MKNENGVSPVGGNSDVVREKPESKSRFRRVNDWLHLWLGLISGIIVFVVCLTGCIWVFNEEILWLASPERHVEYQEKPVLTPSQIAAITSKTVPGEKLLSAYYLQGTMIQATVGDWETERKVLHIQPYSGKVMEIESFKAGDTDFFSFILRGHRFLWLPWEIGRPIVNYATLTFVVLLITGLIWWFPKKWNKTTRQKSFKIKWGASFKRVNLDLHNVLGFYAMLFLLCIALTGMVWGLSWYSEGLYWVTSGGDTLPPWTEASSDSTQANKHYKPMQAMDKAWENVIASHPKSEGFYYGFPDTLDVKSGIDLTVYPSASQFYNAQTYKFDRHTLKALPRDLIYGGSTENASFGVTLRKMNYDIHVGSILGFPGKVLAFLASLIGASLPITGFLIWWGRKFADKGKKKKKTAVNATGNSAPRAQVKPKVKIPARQVVNQE